MAKKPGSNPGGKKKSGGSMCGKACSRACIVLAPVFIVFIGWLLTPLLIPLEYLELDKITEWGLQGPGKDSDNPFLGVYLFDGLNPTAIADMSYCSWNATTRAALCAFGGPGGIFLDGVVSDERFINHTSFSLPVTGMFQLRLFGIFRYHVLISFDEDLLSANITSCMFGLPCGQQPFREAFSASHLPISREKAKWCTAECLAADVPGTWRRTNHWPNDTRGQLSYAGNPDHKFSDMSDSGYTFRPILNKKGELNEANFALAKRKLGGNKLVRPTA